MAPSFSKACSSKSYEVKKIWKNKLFHRNYLSFKFVFRCFFKKRRFIQVIHGYLGQTQNLGARYICSEVRYLQKSLVESTLCHCRRCFSPPFHPLSWGWGWRLLGSKPEQKFAAKMPCVHWAFVRLTDI